MQIANYVNDLLYRYDCVIIPDFGGFVTNKIGAKINEHTHVFYPPTKQISFNTYLKHNDGLLANYIASTEKISFETANERIADTVTKWEEALKTSPIQIASVGSLSFNDNDQLIFEPDMGSNFLIESFGLDKVEASVVERLTLEPEPLISIEPTNKEKKYKKGVSTFFKYSAAAVVATLLTTAVIVYNTNKNEQEQEDIFAIEQKKIEQKIQQATFVIDIPLPAISLNIAKETTKNFHVIVGAFQISGNAKKKANELLNKGFKSEIIGKNKWGLTQVSCGGFETSSEAKKALKQAKRMGYKDAWIFVAKTQ